MKAKKPFMDRGIELVLAGLIVVCVIYIMNTHEKHLEELHGRYIETLFVSSEHIDVIDPELMDLMIEYHPGSYKMIEIYNSNFELNFRLQFNDIAVNDHDSITNHPELIDYLGSHSEGHTFYTLNENEVDVYFRWCRAENQPDEQLIIIYTATRPEPDTWIHSIVCYLILCFTFSIMLLSLLRRSRDKVDQYQGNRKNILNNMER